MTYQIDGYAMVIIGYFVCHENCGQHGRVKSLMNFVINLKIIYTHITEIP